MLFDPRFTPARVAELTGVSPAQQRDWRRHGFLPRNQDGKWKSYSLGEFVEIVKMKALVDAGFTISRVAEHGPNAMIAERRRRDVV